MKTTKRPVRIMSEDGEFNYISKDGEIISSTIATPSTIPASLG
jgi:hypothetical protein